MTKSLFRPLFWGIFLPVNLLSTSICDIPNPQYEIASAEITRNHACWNFWKRMGNCLQWWLVPVFVTLHSAKYWMKAPKLVKTKKSQLKVPVTIAGRKMQFFRNSIRSAQNRGGVGFDLFATQKLKGTRRKPLLVYVSLKTGSNLFILLTASLLRILTLLHQSILIFPQARARNYFGIFLRGVCCRVF